MEGMGSWKEREERVEPKKKERIEGMHKMFV